MENKFQYSYSASEQKEVKRIRDKYLSKEEDKMEQLRRLDASTTKRPTIAALVIGITGCLVFGAGLSFVLAGGSEFMAIGIVIGLIGMTGIALAYPMYAKILKLERERLAPEILKLTEELMK